MIGFIFIPWLLSMYVNATKKCMLFSLLCTFQTFFHIFFVSCKFHGTVFFCFVLFFLKKLKQTNIKHNMQVQPQFVDTKIYKFRTISSHFNRSKSQQYMSFDDLKQHSLNMVFLCVFFIFLCLFFIFFFLSLANKAHVFVKQLWYF